MFRNSVVNEQSYRQWLYAVKKVEVKAQADGHRSPRAAPRDSPPSENPPRGA